MYTQGMLIDVNGLLMVMLGEPKLPPRTGCLCLMPGQGRHSLQRVEGIIL